MIEELTCPNCDHVLRSSKSSEMPDATVATCKNCGLRFNLGMARRLIVRAPEIPVKAEPRGITTSTVDVPHRQTVATQVIVNQESNSLGTAAFVVSILGLLSMGCLAPVGFILALIALGGRPKGMAAAGLILSVIGLLPLFFLGMMLLGGATASQLASLRLEDNTRELEQIKINSVKVDKNESQPYPIPEITISVTNNTKRAIESIGVDFIFKEVGRTVSVADGEVTFLIDSGLEPGESKQIDAMALRMDRLSKLPERYAASMEVKWARDSNGNYLRRK